MMNNLTRFTIGSAFTLGLLIVILHWTSDAYARHWLVINLYSISVDRACRDGANLAYRHVVSSSMIPPPHSYNIYSLADENFIGSGTMTVEVPEDPPEIGDRLYGYEEVYWNRWLNSGDRIFLPSAEGFVYIADVRNCEMNEPYLLSFQETKITASSISLQGIVTSTLHYTYYDQVDKFHIRDVNVRLQAKHAYDNQVKIQLTSPTGTRIVLMTQISNQGSNLGSFNDYPSAGVGECIYSGSTLGLGISKPFAFDDDSNYSLLDTSFQPPYDIVNFKPEGPDYLSMFNGQNAVGDWTLEIIDDDWDPATSRLICWALDLWGIPVYHDTFLPVISKSP